MSDLLLAVSFSFIDLSRLIVPTHVEFCIVPRVEVSDPFQNLINNCVIIIYKHYIYTCTNEIPKI